jgi:hypothetical protein
MFKSLEVSKWNDFSKLVEITNSQKKKLTDEQSLKKWKVAFENIETNYSRNIPVASFAGKMAEYLGDENGVEEFLNAYHKKEMKRLNQHENNIKERVQKKLRIEQYQLLENQLEKEANTSIESHSKTISIKRPIFMEGQRLHELYKQGTKLEPKERHRMAAGLSGILDLTNDDRNSQAPLFTEESWKRIKTHFFKKYKVKTSPLESWTKEKWEYISAKCVEKGDVLYGRKYLDRLCGSNKVSTVEYNTYKFLDSILDTIQNSQHILNPVYPENIPEGDFTFTIWMPLFRRLFNINSNIIRLKPNESVPDDSTSEKVYIYGDNWI